VRLTSNTVPLRAHSIAVPLNGMLGIIKRPRGPTSCCSTRITSLGMP
jgi:hypothetical protein